MVMLARQRWTLYRPGTVVRGMFPTQSGAETRLASVVRLIDWDEWAIPIYLVHLLDDERTLKVIRHDQIVGTADRGSK